jgi:membrane dipeptidase
LKTKYSELSKNEEDRASEVHNKSIVINGLSSAGSSVSSAIKFFNIMRKGGVTAVNATVGSGAFIDPCRSISSKFRAYNIIGCDKYFTAETADDIKRAKRVDGAALIFGFQNTLPILKNKDWLEFFHKLGVRIIQLTYQKMNLVGCGCGEIVASGKDCGLSSFGTQVVKEMNRLGILVDLSHVGHLTTIDAIELSKDPIAFTHTNVNSLHDFCRCKTDEEIKALAEKEGVMGITALSKFVKPRDPEGYFIPATMDDFLDHIDYVVNLVGIDYIGIGTDIAEFRTTEEYEAGRLSPQGTLNMELRSPKDTFIREKYYVDGIPSISKSLNITKGLVGRGYSDNEIEKILGLNFLRLFEKVWK